MKFNEDYARICKGITAYRPARAHDVKAAGERLTIFAPGWKRETHGFTSPLAMVRPNAILALRDHDERPDHAFAEGVELRLYQLAGGGRAPAVVPTIEGGVAATFVARRDGKRITVEPCGGQSPWSLSLFWIEEIAAVEEGTATKGPSGTVVMAATGEARRLSPRLR